MHRREPNSPLVTENFYARPVSTQVMRVRSALKVSFGALVLAAMAHVASSAAQSRTDVTSARATVASLAIDGALVADASSDASAPLPPAERVQCASNERGVSFSLDASTLETACADGLSGCSVTMGFRVRNCSDRRVSLQQVALRSSGGMLTFSFGDDWIAPSSVARRSRQFFGDRDVSAQVEFVAVDDSGARHAGSATLTVRNAPRAQAQAACVACQGVWGRWGMRQQEGCNCRTSDAGRACEDGADCEAGCVWTGSRQVSRGMFVAVGRCAERRMNFGCRTLIEVGARARGPAPRDGRTARTSVCAD